MVGVIFFLQLTEWLNFSLCLQHLALYGIWAKHVVEKKTKIILYHLLGLELLQRVHKN